MKIMFHVFEYSVFYPCTPRQQALIEGGEVQNFFQSQSPYKEGGNVSPYELTCWVRTARPRWDLETFHARASSWALGLGKISILIPTSTYTEIGSGTWKNSEPCLYKSSGIWKNVELPLPSITASKLFLLTYNNKPQKCECLGRWLPQTRAVSTKHVSS